MKFRRRPVFFAIAGLLACVGLARADVPVAMQLTLFAKILRMDRNFKPRGDAVIAIVYQERVPESRASKLAVEEWVKSAPKMRVMPVPIDEHSLDEALGDIPADVFYVTPMRGADVRRIAAIAQRRQIRTMTGVREYTELGISAAIGVRNDRPLIIINLDASRAEGAAYQAQLLQLAELVKTR